MKLAFCTSFNKNRTKFEAARQVAGSKYNKNALAAESKRILVQAI